MKHKWIYRGMILLLLAGQMSGCGKKGSLGETTGVYEITRAEEVQQEFSHLTSQQETNTSGATVEASDWGVPIGNVATNAAQQAVSFTIHVPYDAGVHIGTGIIGHTGRWSSDDFRPADVRRTD